MNILSEQTVACPYCGESIDILVDLSDTQQSYIEDCQVCCRPINMVVLMNDENQVFVQVTHEDE